MSHFFCKRVYYFNGKLDTLIISIALEICVITSLYDARLPLCGHINVSASEPEYEVVNLNSDSVACRGRTRLCHLFIHSLVISSQNAQVAFAFITEVRMKRAEFLRSCRLTV